MKHLLLLLCALGALAVSLPISAQDQWPPRVVIATPDMEFTWHNPRGGTPPTEADNAPPGFLSVPVSLELPKFQSAPLDVHAMDLRFALQPVKAYGAVRPYRHLVGEELYQQPTIWTLPGVRPRPGFEEFFGGMRLGALWNVERPAPIPGGEGGWGWIRVQVSKWPTGNMADESNWNVPARGLACTVRVETPPLPGVYIFNSNAVQRPETFDNPTRTRVWSFSMAGGMSEVELVHDFGYLVIHPPDEWRQIGFELDPLGELVPVHPESLVERRPITVAELLARDRVFQSRDE